MKGPLTLKPLPDEMAVQLRLRDQELKLPTLAHFLFLLHLHPSLFHPLFFPPPSLVPFLLLILLPE